MIISLRGTNGAGKSTIVRAVMKLYDSREQVLYDPPRRRPLGYLCKWEGATPLFVAGHYEIANGGVDTLRSLDETYAMIRERDDAGRHVLYEGKNMSDGARRLLELSGEGRRVVVVLIDHPVDECESAVRARGHNISTKTIRRLHVKSEKDYQRFQEAGVTCFRLSRSKALAQVRELLR